MQPREATHARAEITALVREQARFRNSRNQTIRRAETTTTAARVELKSTQRVTQWRAWSMQAWVRIEREATWQAIETKNVWLYAD